MNDGDSKLLSFVSGIHWCLDGDGDGMIVGPGENGLPGNDLLQPGHHAFLYKCLRGHGAAVGTHSMRKLCAPISRDVGSCTQLGPKHGGCRSCSLLSCPPLGKTAAFALPVLERLIYKPRQAAVTRVLVLVPTRELGIQVHSVTKQLAQFCSITTCLAVGK